MGNAFKLLFQSRKFWMAVLGVINTLVGYYLHLPQEVWVSINALLLVVIVGITAEDAAEKASGTYISKK